MRWYETAGLRFAVGIEDTFVPQALPGRRPLDEYALTQHYEHWHADLALARACGATMIRYGIPWHVVNPARGVWAWSWLDRVAERLAELELEPIVDLMHYGTPLWLEDTFADPAYPARVAEYAARVAERYGAFESYTPLNEPQINAMYCGEWGIWPPHLTGHDGYVALIVAIARGIAESQHAIADVTGGRAVFVHVEAAIRYVGALAGDDARLLQQRRFLAQDLVCGRVDGDHPLARYLSAHGARDDDLAYLRDHPALPDVMGVNYYPSLSTERFVADAAHDGSPADPRPRADEGVAGLEDVIRTWAERYGRPVFLTETCRPGPLAGRLRWLDESIACVRALRAEGVDVVGYTWWPLFDMVHWSYREGTEPPHAYLLDSGLYDLEPDDTGRLLRVPTAAADRFRAHARSERGPA